MSWTNVRSLRLCSPELIYTIFTTHNMRFFIPHVIIGFATLIMSTQSATVTRIACFRFKEDVTAEQKGDRARAFLNLYEQHQDLICGMPKGGKPLNTPLNLTNVKRDSVWDTGFTVTFKVCSPWRVTQDVLVHLRNCAERRGKTQV